MREYQLDCIKFCGYVKTDDLGILVETMPIAQKFVGQPLFNLTAWMVTNFKYCTVTQLKDK